MGITILPTNTYFLGSRVGVLAEFADEDEVPINPSTVTFYVKRLPNGALANYVYGVDPKVTRPDTGNFRFRFTPNAVGTWVIGVEGAGDVEGYEELTVKIVKRKAS